jgi:hypothetical protein
MSAKVAVNKSAEIRKLHASGVTSVKEIVTRLHARGVKVVPSQVYQAIRPGRTKRSRVKAGVATANGSHADVLDTAIVFIRHAGGISKAKELLAKLSLIQN